MNKQKLLKTYGLFFLPLIILLGGALVFLFTNNWLIFKSILLGGLAWLIPHFYFMMRLKRMKMVFSIRQMLVKFFLNELFKLLFSFGLVALVLLTCSVEKIAFWGGYIFMVITSFVISSVYGKKYV